MQAYENWLWSFRPAAVAILVVVVIAARAVAATPAPEAIPPGVEQNNSATSDDTLARIVDFVRFLMVLCDDKPVLKPLLPERTMLSVSLHLSPQGIDLLEKRLSDPDALALLRKGSPQLADLLPLLAAAAPIIREMHPEVQLVLARQDLETVGDVKPAPVLPGAAFVFQPKDAATAKTRMLATYVGLMAALNKTADQQGMPRFTMSSGKRGTAFFASVRPLDPIRGKSDNIDPMRYNFTPAIGVVGDRFIVSTTSRLGSDLVDLALAQPMTYEVVHGPRVDVGPGSTAGLLLDNLDQRLAQDPEAQATAASILGIALDALDGLPHRTRRVPSLRGGRPRLISHIRQRQSL